MSTYDPIRDVFGNIDDFNAVPGKVSSPFVRKFYIDSSVPQEFKNYLKSLSGNGYSKSEVYSVIIAILNDAYDDNEVETHQAQEAITPQSFGQCIPNVIRNEDGHDIKSRNQ